ncbi:low molecular weight phosphatase family protein [Microbacterium esteraromaticum]|uniref:arsenate reductase/protein-tyrosine-phosphatase family protein n=1 Tax=Microbacterium esteraromaticum TaxID=57043 RepID=UPI002367FED8|nr:low molecular weight phosphatase family protein [Microbacterium esteraromaticum]WDH79486.1 low molecular weight phosphatase family protein [Microbacterium esteraromaticum]
MSDEPAPSAARAMTRRERKRMLEGAVPRILTVCTGNICRSAIAEVVLRTSLRDLPVAIGSAGTGALVGHGMTPQAIDVAVRAGAAQKDAHDHRARYLVEPMLVQADLVLAMTREHRDVALQMTPGKRRQVLPVRELARLALAVDDERIRATAARAGSVPADRVTAVVSMLADSHLISPSEADDVIDPYRRSDAVYQQSADELLPALAQVERVMRLALA